jgi:hypothetical protein
MDRNDGTFWRRAALQRQRIMEPRDERAKSCDACQWERSSARKRTRPEITKTRTEVKHQRPGAHRSDCPCTRRERQFGILAPPIRTTRSNHGSIQPAGLLFRVANSVRDRKPFGTLALFEIAVHQRVSIPCVRLRLAVCVECEHIDEFWTQ